MEAKTKAQSAVGTLPALRARRFSPLYSSGKISSTNCTEISFTRLNKPGSDEYIESRNEFSPSGVVRE